MRSLRLDGFRATRIALLIAVVNMLALMGWFFFAKVSLYEVGGNLSWNEEGMIAATFSKEAMPRLRQGQTATVRLDFGADQPAQTLPAYLYRLPENDEAVLFYLDRNDLPDSARTGKLNGQVEVEVEKVTPAQLVLRTSGKFLNQAPAPTANGSAP
jgi:hypothetical protein